MKKGFESELARRASSKKRPSKVWIMVALCAAILMSGAVAVTAVAAYDQSKDRDRAQDGTGDDCEGDGVCDNLEDCPCVT